MYKYTANAVLILILIYKIFELLKLKIPYTMKTLPIKTIITFIICTTLFLSCSNNDDDGSSSGGNEFLTAKIDGIDFSASTDPDKIIGATKTPSIALKVLNLLRNPTSFKIDSLVEKIKLTNRETDILEHLSKGLIYNEIAENLIISPSTVRKHLGNMYKKLQVHNKMEAVYNAKKHKIIE